MESVIWHRLHIPFKHTTNTDITHFGFSGLVFSTPDTTVVIPYESPKLCAFYAEIGIIPEELRTVTNPISGNSLKQITAITPTELDVFNWTEKEETLAQQLGSVTIPSCYNDFVSKALFKKICANIDISTPAGSHVARTSKWLNYVKIMRLFWSGNNSVIIKAEDGVSGLNAEVYNPDTLHHAISTHKDIRPAHELTGTGKYIVEAWIPDVSLSPSIQLLVTGAAVQTLSLHNQLFYQNKRSYRGCESYHTIDPELRQVIERDAVKIGSAYQKMGYRGHLGLNAILSKSSGLLWVEANPRRVISSYAYGIYEKIATKQPYVALEVSNPDWKHIPIDTLIEQCRNRGILFSKASARGVIPFMFFTGHLGRVFFYITAATQTEREKLYEQITNL